MASSIDIDQALQRSYDLFSPKPQWLVLATVTGDYLGRLVQPNISIEIDRLTALAAAAAGHHERVAMEHDLQPVRYGLTFADNGFVITAFVGSERVLSLQFTEANLDALMKTLQVLPKIVDNLFQLESEKRS
jgi:hypothetical protein